MKSKLLLGAALCLLPLSAAMAVTAATPVAPLAGVKNVIVIINDGAGFTVYDATRLYLGAPLVTDGAGFSKTAVSTYPLRSDSTANNKPGTDAQAPDTVYDSAKFWDTTPVAGASTAAGYAAYPAGFKGYEFSRYAHPDSGNTASSIATGVKTYNNAINVDGSGDPQVAITDLIDQAVAVGKSTGVVTVVQFGDATPAALGGAHNIARANREAITNEMFSTGKLDVIGGTANPDYDDNAQPRTPQYAPVGYFGPTLWNDLKNKPTSAASTARTGRCCRTRRRSTLSPTSRSSRPRSSR